MNSILVTGAAGFFGRAFVRHALDLGCTRVCIFSRNEYNQHLMRMEFNDDSRLRWFIGDVRDRERLRRAMDGVETVIHAAALKRIEVGEYNPDELVKTNVMGAMNVIEAALDAGVSNVVALSTDKAAAPYNAYGTSKLMAEKLFLNANNAFRNCQFAVTRYGNVAGSTGSVIPIWRGLLAQGKKLPVTDPECTRFFMTTAEAVELVYQSIGGKTLFVPDLPAYRLGDLAVAMGGETESMPMRDGEKKHEVMISADESKDFFCRGKYWFKAPGLHEEAFLQGRYPECGGETWGRAGPVTSDTARRMSVDELKEALRYV